MQYWLYKTEPGTYSFSDLLKDKKTNWNGVRNYQARNHLRLAKKGDLVLIYHSGEDKAVVGVAEIVAEAYLDKDPDGGDWVQVDIKPVEKLKVAVPLSTIKQDSNLSDMPLIRQSRLSVMPITSSHFKRIKSLSKT